MIYAKAGPGNDGLFDDPEDDLGLAYDYVFQGLEYSAELKTSRAHGEHPIPLVPMVSTRYLGGRTAHRLEFVNPDYFVTQLKAMNEWQANRAADSTSIEAVILYSFRPGILDAGDDPDKSDNPDTGANGNLRANKDAHIWSWLNQVRSAANSWVD